MYPHHPPPPPPLSLLTAQAILANKDMQGLDDVFAFLCPTARTVNPALAELDDDVSCP